MPKPTKSSGIRMSVKAYDWIDRLAAREETTRSECVFRLVKIAGRKLASKPKSSQKPRPRSKPQWTVNVAWAGYFCASIVTALSLGGFIHQF